MSSAFPAHGPWHFAAPVTAADANATFEVGMAAVWFVDSVRRPEGAAKHNVTANVTITEDSIRAI